MSHTAWAVIPAYNEEATIEAVVAATRVHLPVVVVNDGSSDATGDKLRGVDATVVTHGQNQGKAKTLVDGALAAIEAGASHVVTLDGDGQHDPNDIPRLLAVSRAHPDKLIIGARLRHRRSAPWNRRLANSIANFWISWAAGEPIADSQSGFRVYPARIFTEIGAPTDRERSFVFESEIVIEAARAGIGACHVPVDTLYPQGRRASHYRGGADTWLIVKMVARKLRERCFPVSALIRSLGKPEVVDQGP